MTLEELYKKAPFYKKELPGDAEVQFFIGLCYFNGEGAEQNYVEAIKWFIRAAKRGNVDAQCFLGNCYYAGEGVGEDHEEAAKWFERAAKQGNMYAQCELGICYYCGDGVERDYVEAAKWFTRASEQGFAYAQCELGICYYCGDGVEQDYAEAVKWFARAADQGNAQAQYFYGSCYFNGKGIERDYAEAVKWHQKAAIQGEVSAQYVLAQCYQKGIGVEQDYQKAIEWYTKVAEQGLEDAQIALQNLAVERSEELETFAGLANAGKRYDLFISWNHTDQNAKNRLVEGLERHAFKKSGEKLIPKYRAWESDRDASGPVEVCIKNAIDNSKLFVLLLSKDSMASAWVKKEVSFALEKLKDGRDGWTEKNFIIVYLYKDGFRVASELKKLPDGDPIKRLGGIAAKFDVEDMGAGTVDKICTHIAECLKGEALRRYRYHMTQSEEAKGFKFGLRNQYNEGGGIDRDNLMDARLTFGEGYIPRCVYDANGDRIGMDALSGRSFFLVGEGGTGKSLFVRAMLQRFFQKDTFYLQVALIDYSGQIKTFCTLSDLLNDVLRCYFSADGRDASEDLLMQAREDRLPVTIIFDGLDEVGEEDVKALAALIKRHTIHYPHDTFVFTARTRLPHTEISKAIADLPVYSLHGFDEAEQKLLYDRIRDCMSRRVRTPYAESLKEEFFSRVGALGEDVRKNPLLLSNLIFIYLKNRGRDFPERKIEIVAKSVGIFFDELEGDRGVFLNFRYYDLLRDGKLERMLGQIAFRKLQGESRDFKALICEYLRERRVEEPEEKGGKIFQFLNDRAIISRDKITHDVFTAYFACLYLYGKIYKKQSFDDEDCINFSDADGTHSDGKTYLEKRCRAELNRDEGMWPEIAAELIMKLDLEIHALPTGKSEMDGKNVNYPVFSETLKIALKERGFSDAAIGIVCSLAERNGFFYSPFILRSAR